MAKLVKRGSVWYGWVPRAGGGFKRVSTGCSDKRAAEARHAQLEREAVDPTRSKSARTTFATVINDYIASRRRLGRADGTIHHAEVKGQNLLDVLPVMASEIDHGILEKYIDTRLAEGVRRTTIKKELRVLGASWKLARRNGLVSRAVDEIMPELADDYAPRERWLTPWELVALVAELPPHRAAHVAFIVATSANWSESARARHEDVGATLVFLRGTKRETRRRHVPIVGAASSLVAWSLAHTQPNMDDGRLFAEWSNVRHDIEHACKRAGIAKCSPNDLRRTFAKWLRNAGVEPQLIGVAMGHADSRMTERVYGKLAPDALERLLKDRLATHDRDRLMAVAAADSSGSGGPERPPLVAFDGEKQGETRCSGTESNRRHGDFQSAVTCREDPVFHGQNTSSWRPNGSILAVDLAASGGFQRVPAGGEGGGAVDLFALSLLDLGPPLPRPTPTGLLAVACAEGTCS